MPPKNASKKTPKKTKASGENKFTKNSLALICVSNIKNHRTVGSIVKLLWKNAETKETRLYEAKIIAFDTNYDKLNNILLDDKGEVHDFNDKLFTEKVLQQKRKATGDNKTIKKSKIDQKNQLEDQLLRTPSLFSSCKPTESILKQKNSQSVPTATCVSNCTQPPTYTLPSSSISSNVESYDHSSEIHNNYVKINHSAVGHDVSNLKIFNSPKVLSPLSYQCHNLDTHVQTLQSHNYGKARVEDNYEDSGPLDFSKNSNAVSITSIASNTKSFLTTSLINNETSDETDLAHSEISANIEPSALTNDDSRESSDSAAMIINNEPEKIDNIEEIQTSEPDVGALHTFFPKEVTEETIQFFESVHAGIKQAHEQQTKKNSHLSNDTKIPQEFYIPGENKIEIWVGSGLYLPTERMIFIVNNSADKKQKPSWKKFVGLVMLEVYGESIGNFSAKGLRGSQHLGIDSKLFAATFDLVKSKFTDDKITKKATYLSLILWHGKKEPKKRL
ncbi:uncharacterized protein LOC141532969 [Cotesia typhae]|uniref:uncharacterized protein LOC141532969 n=1 Tax=Cotesia typhae TaxID=2053667 RepID=UPI003D69EF01